VGVPAGKLLLSSTIPSTHIHPTDLIASGKSSLVLSLLGMIDLGTGSVTIDGIDTSTIPRDELRSKIVAVPQEAPIFSDTVRLNADPSGTCQDEEIIEVLRRVCLWDKIEPRGGLDAEIDENFLSQGQGQLLAIARAMLRRSRVLILDEVTSRQV